MNLKLAVGRICEAGEAREPLAVHLLNAYSLSLASRQPSYADVLDGGDLNLPDGAPVGWLGRRAGFGHMQGRVCGRDVFRGVVDEGRQYGLRHYLYGSTEPVVTRLAAWLRETYPGVEIAGEESPPFRRLTGEEQTRLVERVGQSGANVVWVGLGTPKQDQFVEDFRDRLGVPLIAVGAAFDFLAGTKATAPEWMQERGLEWLHRLSQEPRRLWKRYLFGNVAFLAGVAKTGVERVEALR